MHLNSYLILSSRNSFRHWGKQRSKLIFFFFLILAPMEKGESMEYSGNSVKKVIGEVAVDEAR